MKIPAALIMFFISIVELCAQELTIAEYSDYRTFTFKVFQDSVGYIKNESNPESPEYRFYELKKSSAGYYAVSPYVNKEVTSIVAKQSILVAGNDSVGVGMSYNEPNSEFEIPATMEFPRHIKLIVNLRDTFSLVQSKKSLIRVYPVQLRVHDTIQLFNSYTREKTLTFIVSDSLANYIEIQPEFRFHPFTLIIAPNSLQFSGTKLTFGKDYCDFEFPTEILRMAIVSKTIYYGKKRAKKELQLNGFSK